MPLLSAGLVHQGRCLSLLSRPYVPFLLWAATVSPLCNTLVALRSSTVRAVLNFPMDVMTLPCATLVVPDQQSTRQQSTRQQPYPALLAYAHAVFLLVICTPSLARRLRRNLSSLSKQWGCRHRKSRHVSSLSAPSLFALNPSPSHSTVDEVSAAHGKDSFCHVHNP